MNNTKEHSASGVRECDGSEATTNPSDLSTLDDQSLEVLIQHYLSVQHRLPDNLTVRERLLELEREQFNRERKADAESEANNREKEQQQ